MIFGLDAGADNYLVKPFDPEELRARLQGGVRLVEITAETERLFGAISSILIGVDATGRVTRWNSAAQETFGPKPAEVIGRPLMESGIEWAAPELVTRALQQPAPVRLEKVPFVDREGRRRLVDLTVTTVQRGPGRRDGFVLLGSEATERHILEEQLRQAQKLEGIGQLAAGIAHEINTPLQYVGDNVRFLQDSYANMLPLMEAIVELARAPRDGDATRAIDTLVQLAERADLSFLVEEIPASIAQSLEGVQRVSQIVQAMKDFSHPGTKTKIAVDLNRAIHTTVTVARNELKYVADTKIELDPDLPFVPCLPGEINQVLLNVLINAAHAVNDAVRERGEARGLITVSTHTVGDAVEIRVSDNGTGIPEHIRSRVFEPFFTTKEVGRGTGQGLALAHTAIVKKHGGEIWFETEVGKGTTFFIRLPLALSPAQVA
jgi:PAS domain S-box-containing protein